MIEKSVIVMDLRRKAQPGYACIGQVTFDFVSLDFIFRIFFNPFDFPRRTGYGCRGSTILYERVMLISLLYR